MAGLVTAVDAIVTGAVGWIGDYISAIGQSGNEILLFFMLIPVVGLGVGLIKRMISL